MNGEQDQNKGVQFDSSDIGKKETPDYFAGRIKKNKLREFIKSVFEGNRKFVTIGIVATVLVAVVVFIFWLTAWSNAPNNDQSSASEDLWAQELVDINGEAYSILGNPDLVSAYSDAIEYYDEQIEMIEDDDRKFDIIMARANFMTYNGGNGGAESAIRSVSEIDEDSLTNEQKHKLFLAFRSAYQKLDDNNSVQKYDDRINELPKDVTTQGDSADE